MAKSLKVQLGRGGHVYWKSPRANENVSATGLNSLLPTHQETAGTFCGGPMIDSIKGSDLLSKRAQVILALFAAFTGGGLSPLLAVFLAVCIAFVLHR